MEEMKTLTIGDTTYEIVDQTARDQAAAAVKTINGNAPDENGNVEVGSGSGGDFGQYGLGETANIVEIPSDYALGDFKKSGWYTVRLSYGTVDFGDGYTANKFLLRVETGECEQYNTVTKQTAMFSSYPGGEEYVRYCKNGYDWTAWEKVIHHPKTLTFTGAVNATYDGSEAVEVEIPQGGGGDNWELILDVTTEEEVNLVSVADVSLKKMLIQIETIGSTTNTTNTNGTIEINGQIYYFSNALIMNTAIKRWVFSYVEVLGDSKIHISSTNNLNSYQSNHHAIGWFGDGTPITSIDITAMKSSPYVIGSGSNIKVWGVRA